MKSLRTSQLYSSYVKASHMILTMLYSSLSSIELARGRDEYMFLLWRSTDFGAPWWTVDELVSLSVLTGDSNCFEQPGYIVVESEHTFTGGKAWKHWWCFLWSAICNKFHCWSPTSKNRLCETKISDQIIEVFLLR